MKLSTQVIVIISIIALIAGVWVAYHNLRHDGSAPLTNINATVLLSPRPIPPFSLIDDNQQPFTEKNFQGKWTLVFFGFTQCPELCPTTLSKLNQIYQQLIEKNKNLQIVFITVDPDNDKPTVLKKYVSKFNSAFIGVTGQETKLTDFRKQLGIIAERAPIIYHPREPQMSPEIIENIEHSGAVLMINPEGSYYAVFSMPHDVANMVNDIGKIQDYYQRTHRHK